jgi:dTDP-4-dehydrorhamnose reductase
MLGSAVVDTIRTAGYPCLTSSLRYGGGADDPLVGEVLASDASVVVNCAGITTHRQVTGPELLIANALLPQHLASALGPERLLFHASTDCVFSGLRGRYRVDEAPDATDAYGVSKRLGELSVRVPAARVIVLRTSIIGPEVGTARGLLAWFLSQPGPVRGWQNHFWNGITTLTWARLMLEIVTGARPLPEGIHQPGTDERESKYELLEMIGAAFNHRITIEPVTMDAPSDRTLEPTLRMPPIDVQLQELAEWWRRLPETGRPA